MIYSATVGAKHGARVVTTTDPALATWEYTVCPFWYFFPPILILFTEWSYTPHAFSIFLSSNSLDGGLLRPFYRWRDWGTATGSQSWDLQPGSPVPQAFCFISTLYYFPSPPLLLLLASTPGAIAQTSTSLHGRHKHFIAESEGQQRCPCPSFLIKEVIKVNDIKEYGRSETV